MMYIQLNKTFVKEFFPTSVLFYSQLSDEDIMYIHDKIHGSLVSVNEILSKLILLRKVKLLRREKAK